MVAATASSTEGVAAGQGSYVQILKSTIAIGASSVVGIGFGIVRSKCLALLLGPSGIGLFGLYNSIVDLSASIASLGIQTSGVRQIAEAAGTQDEQRIARAVTVLRQISVLLGLAGGVLLAALSLPVSLLTFGNEARALPVALLGVAVLLRLVGGGQTALIQGLRRIGDLAWLAVLAAAGSTLVSVPIVYLIGEEGIVPSIIAMTLASTTVSWWFDRRTAVKSVRMTVSQKLQESVALLKLGAAFLASGLLTLGASYAIRLLVLRYAGVEQTGLYQAAWTLGGLYAGFVLQAMGTDFYPRLTAVAKDNAKCSTLVNEQAEIGMLIATPGVLATLTFAPIVVVGFYSSEFYAAGELLRWICLGMALRVVAWPIGYIVVAKGEQLIFFATEVATTVIHLGLTWLLIVFVGLDGVGQAFCLLYVWHTVLIYFIAHRRYGFRFSLANKKLGVSLLASTALVFGSTRFFSVELATLIGATAVFLSGAFSIRRLRDVVPAESVLAITQLGNFLSKRRG